MFIKKSTELAQRLKVVSGGAVPASLTPRKMEDAYAGTQKRAATVSAAGPVPDLPRNERLQSDLHTLPQSFLKQRRDGQNFQAFKTFEALKKQGDAITALPADEFGMLWHNMLPLTSDDEVRTELTEWMLELAIGRTKALLQSDATKEFADTATLSAAMQAACQAHQAAVKLADNTDVTAAFWRDLEKLLVPTLHKAVCSYAIEERGDALKTHVPLLSPLFEAGEQGCKLAQKAIIEMVSAAHHDCKSIGELPWLLAFAREHKLDAPAIAKAAGQSLYLGYGRDGLVKLPLESLSGETADVICQGLIDGLLHEGKDMFHGKVDGVSPGPNWAYEYDAPPKNFFPFKDLEKLPEIMMRLSATDAAKKRVVQAVEEAVEIVAQKVYDASAGPVRQVHAAWLFATGLQTEISCASHLESMLNGFEMQFSNQGWRPATTYQEDARCLSALISAAQAQQLPIHAACTLLQKVRTKSATIAQEWAEAAWAEHQALKDLIEQTQLKMKDAETRAQKATRQMVRLKIEAEQDPAVGVD